MRSGLACRPFGHRETPVRGWFWLVGAGYPSRVMSEAERRTLSEIETRLAVEEPALASALVAGKPRNPVLSYALVAVFAGLGVLLLALGSFGSALGALGFAALLVLMRGYTWR